jgi:YggT family protein
MRCAIHYVLLVYWIILLIRVLSSWFRPPMSGPIRTVLTLVYDLTDPVLRPFRGLIPPIRMGAMAMDLSPILLFIVIGVLQNVVFTC